jgi:Ran GTPase-activating protein (RanGAP) involved in mRNA processing and transport
VLVVRLLTSTYPLCIALFFLSVPCLGIERGGGGFKSCDSLLKRVEQNDEKLETLVVLPMKTFGDAEAKRLAKALGSNVNTHLKEISASGHKLSNEALRELGEAIVKSGRIQRLSVGDKTMGDEGVMALCGPFEQQYQHPHSHGGLVELDLSQKGLSSSDESGFAAVGRAFGSSHTLKHLNLSNNPGTGNVGALAQAGMSVQTTDTKHLPCCFPALQVLNLTDTQLGAGGLEALTKALSSQVGNKESSKDNDNKNDTPLELIMSHNPLLAGQDDGEASSLQPLQSILSHEASGNHGRVVTALNLSHCELTDECIQFVCDDGSNGYGERSLLVLNLANNKLTTDGAKALAKALSTLPTCTTIHSATPPCHLGHLRDLNLAKNNSIKGEGLLAIAAALDGPHRAAETSELDNDNLPGHTVLDTLDLSQTGCTPEAAVALLKCTSLKSLRLFDNNLGSDGFAAMTPLLKGGHATLEHLDLGGSRASGEATAALLQNILEKLPYDTSSVLHTLELGGNDINAEGDEALKQLAIQQPKLDIAKDKPLVQQGEEEQEEEG